MGSAPSALPRSHDPRVEMPQPGGLESPSRRVFGDTVERGLW